jgi:hypothetical protein
MDIVLAGLQTILDRDRGPAERPLAPEHAVSVIRNWATDHTRVNIEYVTAERRPLAKQIDDIFALAGGWPRQFGDNPQVAVPYFEGIRVQGYSRTLVEAIAVGLRDTGIPGVQTQTDSPVGFDPGPDEMQTIWITVGYGP